MGKYPYCGNTGNGAIFSAHKVENTMPIGTVEITTILSGTKPIENLLVSRESSCFNLSSSTTLDVSF